MLRSVLSGILAVGVTASLTAQACFDSNIGASLALTDDSNSAAQALGFSFTFNGVAYTDVVVCSNGYIWFGPTGAAADYTATEAELLTGAPRFCPLWGDFNPSAVGSGNVHFNATPGTATITWNGVYEFGRTTPITLQVVLDAASNIKVHYGGTAPLGGTFGGGTPILVGASPGLGAISNPVSFAPRPVVIGQNTFHQLFPAPPVVPLAGATIVLNPTSPGYVITDAACVGPASFVAVGSGCPGSAGTPVPAAGDDTTHQFLLPFAFPHASGPYTDIWVSTNGFVTLGLPNPGAGCCAGNVAAMLSGQPRIAAFWQDLYRPGGGEITTAVNVANGDFEITWKGVPEFALTTPGNTFQIALSPSGNIAIRYGTVQQVAAARLAVCGYSNGLGALDPGASDLSTLATPSVNTVYETFTSPGTPIDLSGLNFLLMPNGLGGYVVLPGAAGGIPSPLTLKAAPASLPILGTTFTSDVSGIAPAPNGNIVLLLLSTEIPPFNLGVINMPGCNAYIALPEFMSFLNLTFGSPTTSFPINIPNNMAFAGVQIMTQAISDDLLANPFGWRASNGGRWTIGL